MDIMRVRLQMKQPVEVLPRDFIRSKIQRIRQNLRHLEKAIADFYIVKK